MRRRRGRPSRWRGRTGSCGWRRAMPGVSSSTPNAARSGRRRRSCSRARARADPDGGPPRGHDVSGPGNRWGRALGIDPETRSDRLEDDRRAPPWPTPLDLRGDRTTLDRSAATVATWRSRPSRSHRGASSSQKLPRPGDFSLPAGLRLRLELGGKPSSVIVPDRQTEPTLGSDEPAKRGAWREVGLPAAPAADPIVWGSGVFVPGPDSRAYLIDPFTGRSQRRAVRAQVRSRPSGRPGCRRPGWIATRSCWPTTSAGSFGSRSRRRRSPGWWARPRRVLDQRIIADPASTGERRDRGDRRPACPSRWRPAT